jgi:hypothetical protein
MRPALDPTGHRVPRTMPTFLLLTWRPHRQRPFALVLHLHQHESSRNLHLQYLAKNQSTQRCQSLITQGSDHPPVLEPHMVLSVQMPRAKASVRTVLAWGERKAVGSTAGGVKLVKPVLKPVRPVWSLQGASLVFVLLRSLGLSQVVVVLVVGLESL